MEVQVLPAPNSLVMQSRDAVENYERAIQLAPKWPEAHLSLGKTYGLMDKPKLAAQHYRRAIQISPDYLAAHYNLGIVLGHLGEYEEAITAMERALTLANKAGRTDLIPRIRDRIEKLRATGESRSGDAGDP